MLLYSLLDLDIFCVYMSCFVEIAIVVLFRLKFSSFLIYGDAGKVEKNLFPCSERDGR